jgi:hypothetical protein
VCARKTPKSPSILMSFQSRIAEVNHASNRLHKWLFVLQERMKKGYMSALKELTAIIASMEKASEAGHQISTDDLQKALDALGWKQADLWRKAGLNKDTPSRWLSGKTPIPLWVGAYLGTMLEIRRLHEKHVKL